MAESAPRAAVRDSIDHRPTLPQPRPGFGMLWWGVASLVVYHILSIALLLVAAPALLWRVAFNSRYRAGLRDRVGRVSPSQADTRSVWVHGVSVGEVKAAATLIASLRANYPELDIVVSTTTATGQQIARELYPDVRVIYYPIDCLHFPGRALNRIRPMCVLLMELEIWPNFLQAAAVREIPLAVVSGRISESSFRGYRWVRWLLPQLQFVDLYCMQIPEYRDRLLALRVPADRIVVTGNLKYDGVMPEPARERAKILREWLVDDHFQHVVVCGSTHGREDEWVVEALDRVSVPARIVTVPRHPERAAAVVEALEAIGRHPVLWSTLTARADGARLPELAGGDILVIDTVGQLEAFYGACDVAFVGGSLVPHGGQNMLEPVALGKPVVFGPYTSNFRTDVELLLGAEAAIRVANPESLSAVLGRLLGDPEERAALAGRGSEVIRSNQGATDRTMNYLRPLLERT